MPGKVFFQPQETKRLADSLDFEARSSNDIWGLSFSAQADDDIDGLGNLLKMPDPLPVVVSDRPDAMQIRQRQQEQASPMPTAPQRPSVTFQDGRTEPQQRMRPGETVGDVAMTDGSLEAWARSEARRLGIDEQKAVDVANTEGGFADPTRQNMRGAPAYGPYQAYIGGPENPGLGDEMLAHGIDPRKPADARRAITYSLEHAARNGWGAFQGAADNGIGQWDGIGQAPRPGQTTPPQAEDAAHEYEVAFGFNQAYSTPFNANIPRHRGVDLVVRGAEQGGRGSPVKAFRGGTVYAVTSDPNGGNGLIVATGDPDAPYDYYGHFDATNVENGQTIRPGEQIGVLGASGTEGFPHLHYEVRRNVNGDPMDQLIDPTPYMRSGRTAPNAGASPSAPAPSQAPDAASPSAASGVPVTMRHKRTGNVVTVDPSQLPFMTNRDEFDVVDDRQSQQAPSQPTAAAPAGHPGVANPDQPEGAYIAESYTANQADPQQMWSPDEPASAPVTAQMGAGRMNGGIMARQPLLPTDPEATTGAEYDPRDADQGARESGYTVGGGEPGSDAKSTPLGDDDNASDAYAPPAPAAFSSGGRVTAPDYTYSNGGEPIGEAPSYEMPVRPTHPQPVAAEFANGGELTSAGSAEAVEVPVRSRQAAQPSYNDPTAGGTQDEPLPSQAAFSPPASGLQAVYDEAGNFLHWIQGQAQSVARRITPVQPGASYLGTIGQGIANVAEGRTPGGQTPAEYAQAMTPRRDTMVAPEAALRDILDVGTNAPRVPGAADQAITDVADRARENFRTGSQAWSDGEIGSALYDLGAGAIDVITSPYTVAGKSIDALLPTMANGPISMGDAITNLDLARDIRALSMAGIKVTRPVIAALRNGTAVEDLIGLASRGLNRAADTVDAGIEGAQSIGTRVRGALAANAENVADDGVQMLGSGVVPRGAVLIPGRSTLANAAQGAAVGAASENLQAEAEGREVDPGSQLARGAMGAGLGVLAGNRAARRAVGAGARRLGSGVIPDEYGRPYPPIRGTVEGMVRHQLGDQSAEMLADSRFPRDRVPSDMQASIGPVDDVPRTVARNAAVPFDPTSAALGAGAGAASEDEEGNQADPLRTGLGAVAAGILNRRGRGANPVGPINPRRLAAGIQHAATAGRNMPNPVPGLPALPPSARPSAWEWAQTWRYGMSMFGQLSTMLMQVGGGLAEVPLGAATTGVQHGLLRGHPEHIPQIVWESLKSPVAGAKAFGQTAAGNVPPTIMAGSDYRPPMSDSLTGAAKGVARAIEAPGRIATQAPDAAWYEMFYRSGLAVAAAEEAQKQLGSARSLVGAGVGAASGGAAGAATAPEDASPTERAARIAAGVVGGGLLGRGAANVRPASIRLQRQLIANPTPEMIQRAHEIAQDATYKGDLGALGQLGEIIVKGPSAAMVSGLPPQVQRAFSVYREIASHFMPVYRTIARITEGGAEYTPGLGLLPLDKIGLAAKGRPLDQKVAQQIVGLGVMMPALAYAASGGIRGPGPKDPDVLQEMRDQGYETNTTNIGGLWVQNAYLGRAGVLLNMVGALNDAIVYGDGKDSWTDIAEHDPHFRKRIGTLVTNFGRAYQDYPTASAFSKLFKTFSDPVAGLSEFAGEAAAQYVPGPIRTYATATDPKMRRPDRSDEAGPVELASDAFRQRSGVGRQSLPVAQNRLGEEVENQRAGWAALFPRVGKDRPHPVIQAFIDNKVEIPKKRERVTIDGLEIPLTPPLQRKWQAYMGEYLNKEVPKTTKSAFWNRPTTTVGDRADELRDLAREASEDAVDRIQDDIGKEELKRLMLEAERKTAKQRGERVPAGR